MPPNKQGRKQRTRGKNSYNIPRERTVLTLADSTSASFMHPSQTPFTPNLGNMFNPYHSKEPQQQQQPQLGGSIPEMTGFPHQQQQQKMAPTFGGQGPTLLDHMRAALQGSGQPAVQQQLPPSQQQPSSPGEVSDIEKLRKLKQTILSGQHPFFQPVPNPDALASLYLGPHPLSQAFQEQKQEQSDQLGSLSQSQSDNTKVLTGAQRPDVVSPVGSSSVLNAAKRPQTPNTTSGHVSRVSGSLVTPQSMSPSAFNPPSSHQAQKAANGSVGSARIDHSSGRHHHSIIIPPRSHDFRTSTPSPLPPNSAKSSASFVPQKYQRGSLPSSSASGVDHDQSRVPPPTPVTASAASLHDSAGGSKPPTAANDTKDTDLYKGTHPDASSLGELDRDKDRDNDRDRSGYLPYDSPRYSQPTDRRDSGRYHQRYPDSKYDRDREWNRGRDWDADRERDRERERERDRERDRLRDRFDYDRSSKPLMERRPPPPPPVPPSAPSSGDQKPVLPLDQRPVPGLGVPSEPHRSEVPPHPEQRPRPDVSMHTDQRRPEVPTHVDQHRSEAPVHADQRRPEVPVHADQRRPEASVHADQHRPGVPGHPDQHRPEVPVHPEQRGTDDSAHPERPREVVSHVHHQSHGSEPSVSRPAPEPPSAERRLEPVHAPYSNQSHDRDRLRAPQGPSVTRSGPPGPTLSTPLRTGRHTPSVPPPANDHNDLQSVPSNQGASSGNTLSGAGPSPEMNRRPDTANSSAAHPSADINMDDASHPAPERRLTHPTEPEPPRVPLMTESRAGQGQGQDDREISRPFYPTAIPTPILRSASGVPSSGPRRASDSYDTPRERDRATSISSTPYREPLPPNNVPSRGYQEDSRRQSLEANAQRRVSDHFYPPSPPHIPAVVDRRDEVRQWRERESYTPVPYAGSEAERERPRRYPAEWTGDAYSKDRDPRVSDLGVHPRPRPPPPPPVSWDRDRSIDARDRDKERDGYENWANVERKYPARGITPTPPPLRWEEPTMHPHRPLHTRLTDTYDDRFIPREVVERVRYPPSPNEAIGYRENPRVRQRSPSPIRRPGPFDDAHRAPKRPREEYEAHSRPPYEYPPRAPSPPYYDPRAPALSNPREPSPYDRDRVPDPYRRDMPPPRTPPYYPRDRYPPPR